MNSACRERSGVLAERTLVLNRTWAPVHVTTVRHALVMMYHRAALAVCPKTYTTHDFSSWLRVLPNDHHRVVRTVCHEIPAPDIILLAKYDRFHISSIPFSRRNLYRRDQLRCQYCGRRQLAEALTIDHVVPRSQGGSTNWSNCVLACKACNRKKGGRTPDQAGMKLLNHPVRPDWSLVAGPDAGRLTQGVLERWGTWAASRVG
jgi:5-methylcytosine-specific restriction endonuclease McrA